MPLHEVLRAPNDIPNICSKVYDKPLFFKLDERLHRFLVTLNILKSFAKCCSTHIGKENLVFIRF